MMKQKQKDKVNKQSMNRSAKQLMQNIEMYALVSWNCMEHKNYS